MPVLGFHATSWTCMALSLMDMVGKETNKSPMELFEGNAAMFFCYSSAWHAHWPASLAPCWMDEGPPSLEERPSSGLGSRFEGKSGQ